MQSCPARVAGFGLKPSPRHPGLLSLLTGACVNDVPFVRAINHSVEEELVLPAALPIGSRQGLTAAHDNLGQQALLGLNITKWANRLICIPYTQTRVVQFVK